MMLDLQITVVVIRAKHAGCGKLSEEGATP
jgi:hypothetical protein